MKLKKIMFILILITLIIFIFSKNNFIKEKLGDVIVNIKFKTITKNMETKKLDNTTYYYSNKSDETYINNIEKYIKEGEFNTVPLLGQTIRYPYNIIIFTTPEAYAKEFGVNPKENGALTLLNSKSIKYLDLLKEHSIVKKTTIYACNDGDNIKFIGNVIKI